eukprot:6181117-Pleurochrysis_carterae.AAC.3
MRRSAAMAVYTDPTIQKLATDAIAAPLWCEGSSSAASAKIGGVAAPTPTPARSLAQTSIGRLGLRAAANVATVERSIAARRTFVRPSASARTPLTRPPSSIPT